LRDGREGRDEESERVRMNGDREEVERCLAKEKSEEE
jgi:hypothetical protein